MIIDTLRSVLRFRRFELSATKRRLQRAASIEDLRRIARRRLPGGVFDYIDGGAEDEVAMDRNTRGFRELEFVPRVLRDMGSVDTTGTILGREVPFPLILAPTGFTRIAPPSRRAGRRPGRGTCRTALFVVDDGDSVGGGSGRGQQRLEVVPGLCVA